MIFQEVVHGDTLEYLKSCKKKYFSVIIDDAPYEEDMHGLGVIPSQEILKHSFRVKKECLVTFTSSHTTATQAYMKYKPIPTRQLTWASEFKLGAVQSNGMIWRTQNIWCWDLPAKQYVKCIDFDILKHNTEGNHWWCHKGTKPLALIKDLLAAFCPPGGLVLDRYCGSGTTLVAAYQLGMSAIGVDRDQESIDITKERLRREQLQIKLFSGA